MPHVKNVGEKVRKIRESKHLTVEELADKSKLSKELITGIEENKDLPFLAPLIRIARSLDVHLGTFLDDAIELGPVIARAGTRKPEINIAHKNIAEKFEMNFSPLASEKAGRHMEPFIIDIKPSKDKEFHLSSHQGEEFLYVLSGEIEISYGSEVYNITEGESIYYDSIVNHHIHTGNDKSARILAVVYSPC
jgi:transcriptional regulator with XRE-family HTH domain